MNQSFVLCCLLAVASLWPLGGADVGHKGDGRYNNAVMDGQHSEMDEEGRHRFRALDKHVHAEKHNREHNFEDEYGNRDHVLDSSGREKGRLRAIEILDAYGRHKVRDKYFLGQDHGSHYGAAFKGRGANGYGHGVAALGLGSRSGLMFGHSAEGLDHHGFGHSGFGHSGFGHGDGVEHLGLHGGDSGAAGLGNNVLGHMHLGHRPYGRY